MTRRIIPSTSCFIPTTAVPALPPVNSHGDTATANLLCYRRAKATAGGCDWDVHFLTDGSIQQFAVAAFATSSCALPVKTCNTYR